MQVSIQKKIWWVLLIAGFSGTLIYIILIRDNMPSMGIKYIPWPCTTFSLVPLSIWRLRACYKKEPVPAGVKWHLNITDLIAAAIYTGFMFTICRSISPNTFIPFGIPLSMTLGAGFVGGLLNSSRKNFTSQKRKYVYAFGFSNAFYGISGLISLAVVLIVVAIIGEHPIEFFKYVLDFSQLDDKNWWLLLIFRLSFFFAPIGYLIMWYAVRSARQSVPPPIATPVAADSTHTS